MFPVNSVRNILHQPRVFICFIFYVLFIYLLLVPPSTPYLYINQTEILNGENVTITCSGNTGLPGGAIVWSIRKPNERSFVELPEDSAVSMATTLSNGTRWTASSVELHLTDVDDQSVIRCQTNNRVLRFWEKKPEATMLLTVLCMFPTVCQSLCINNDIC